MKGFQEKDFNERISVKGFRCLHICSSRTCNSEVNNYWRQKRCGAVGEKYIFLQIEENIIEMELW